MKLDPIDKELASGILAISLAHCTCNKFLHISEHVTGGPLSLPEHLVPKRFGFHPYRCIYKIDLKYIYRRNKIIKQRQARAQ